MQQSSDFSLVSYCELDGVRTLPDSAILELWDRMEAMGVIGTHVFYDGLIQDRYSFLREMKSPFFCLYILTLRGDDGRPEPAALVWLTHLEAKSAHAHFCGFRNVRGRAAEAIRFTLGELLHYRLRDGAYAFDTILGETPVWNTLAIRAALKGGFRKIGPVPQGVYNAREGRSEPAILTYCDRETLRGA